MPKAGKGKKRKSLLGKALDLLIGGKSAEQRARAGNVNQNRQLTQLDEERKRRKK